MSSQGSARAACIFCGATDQKMTNEHVWPEWIGDLLPPDVKKVDHRYTFHDAERGEYRRLEGLPPHALTIRDVCEGCNNGWMNRSEEDARSLVTEMMRGRVALDESDQAKLAFWAILKGLVAVHASRKANPTEFPLKSDYDGLYAGRENRMPPKDFLVNIAFAGWSVTGDTPAGHFRLNGISRQGHKDGDEFDGYALAFTTLYLVVMVIRIPGVSPTAVVPFDNPMFGQVLPKIWPAQPGVVQWPPQESLPWDGLEAILGGPIRPDHA